MENIPSIPDKFDDDVFLKSCHKSALDNTISYVVEFKNEVPANKRGEILMNLEDCLCSLNSQIRVWHISLGDKNSLRNLRGISLN